MCLSALGSLLLTLLVLGCRARQQPVQGQPQLLEGQADASPGAQATFAWLQPSRLGCPMAGFSTQQRSHAARKPCHAAINPRRRRRPAAAGRALAQSPPPLPSAEPPPRFSSDSNVQWSVLRASHGGSIVQDPSTGLRYIAVPSAASLGTVLQQEHQPNATACAAACTRHRNCAAFNWCPADASPGCRMDSTLSFLPPGSCHTLQPTAILTPSILPLLAAGGSLQTVADAPLAPDLLALPQDAPGYEALLGFSLFGVGNNVSWGCRLGAV